MQRMKTNCGRAHKIRNSLKILNGFCNTCILIFQYLTLVILQLNCRSILRSELNKMKEENNQLDGINRRQNLELQDLRYNIYEYAQIKSQIHTNMRKYSQINYLYTKEYREVIVVL